MFRIDAGFFFVFSSLPPASLRVHEYFVHFKNYCVHIPLLLLKYFMLQVCIDGSMYLRSFTHDLPFSSYQLSVKLVISEISLFLSLLNNNFNYNQKKKVGKKSIIINDGRT